MNIQPLENLTLFQVHCSIWTGTATVKREKDLAEIQDKLPPRDFVSDGVMHLVDSTYLCPLTKARKAYNRELGKLGFPLMGGYAVKNELADEAMRKLDAIQQEFEQNKLNLAAGLTGAYQAQEAKFSQWIGSMRSEQIDELEFLARCRFGYMPYRAVAAAGAEEQFNESGSIAAQSFAAELAKEANRMLTTSMQNDKIGQRTVNRVRALVEKLDDYSMLNPGLYGPVPALYAQLDSLAKSGYLEPSEVLTLGRVLGTLSTIEEVVDDSVTPDNPEDDIEGDNTEAAETNAAPSASASEEQSESPAPEPDPATEQSKDTSECEAGDDVCLVI